MYLGDKNKEKKDKSITFIMKQYNYSPTTKLITKNRFYSY